MAVHHLDPAHFMQWLQEDTLRRDLVAALHNPLKRLGSQFSSSRARALQELMDVISSITPAQVATFARLQDEPALDVVRHVFARVLQQRISNPVAIVDERRKALEVLLGVCLLCRRCRLAVNEVNGLEVLLATIQTSAESVQIAALHALLAALAQCDENIRLFVAMHGARVLGDVIFAPSAAPLAVRVACAEALLLLSMDEHFLKHVGGRAAVEAALRGPANLALLAATVRPDGQAGLSGGAAFIDELSKGP